MKTFKRLAAGLLAAAVMLTGAVTASAAGTKDTRIIVSLGDSYSSGEGIPPFGSSTTAADKVKDPDWIAHRSDLAWGGKLTLSGVDGTMADHRGTNWFFAAASGATTGNITGEFTKSYNYNDLTGTYTLDPQTDIFKQIKSGDTDYVTMTIGGNDIGFADIMMTAFMKPDTLDERLEKAWKDYADHIRDDLKNTYKAVEKAAGKQAAIIVAGYPHLMNPEGFTVSYLVTKVKVKASTVKKVNDATDKLNGEISALVDECRAEGMNIWFAPVVDEFSGHEAYTKKPYINGIVMGRQEEDMFSIPGGISGYSLHPNEEGAKAYANAVQKVIDKLESGTAESTVPTPTATVKTGKITIKWNAVSGAEKYRLMLYTDGKYKSLKTTTKTSLTISGVKSGTKYKYAVRAYVNGKWTAIEKASTITVKAK